MKIYVVDDNKTFLKAHDHIGLPDSVEVLAHQLAKLPLPVESVSGNHQLLQTDDILLINVNLLIGSEKRQYRKGIELLTWLRVKGVMNHCAMYSFESIEHIARADRKNHILFSKGTSFVRLPDNFVDLNFDGLSKELADDLDLKKCFKSIFDVNAFRHRDANWWGVKQLWDVHKIASEGSFTADYPEHVTKQLLQLNNAVAGYLHGLEVKDVVKTVDEFKKRHHQLKIDAERNLHHLNEKIDALRSDAQNWEGYTLGLRADLSKLQEAQKYASGDYYMTLSEQAKELRRDVTDANEQFLIASGELSNDLEQLKILVAEINELECILSALDSKIHLEFFGTECHHQSNQCKILLIDDNALNGWKDILEKVLPATVEYVVPDKKYKNDIDGLYRTDVKSNIEQFDSGEAPSLILLDLRLFDETERSIDIEHVSGRLLLEKIRSDFKGTPILVTTASNKVWTFQQLINLGADALWVKEGLDELRNAEDSIRNYCRLKLLVSKMTDGRYQVAKNLYDYAVGFEKNKNAHWSCKQITWSNHDATIGDVGAIVDVLNDSALVLKNYLHYHHLEFGNKDKVNEVFIISGLINKLCGIYESIHGLPPRGVTWHDFLFPRGDYFAEVLRSARNDYSHAGYANNPHSGPWEILERSVERVIDYLNRPNAPINIPAKPVAY